MERWVVASKKADFKKIGVTFGIDPVIARLIRNRDIIGEEEIRKYLSGSLEDLPSPWLLKDMDKAADLTLQAIRDQKKIRILGDYDIDGVMASCILLEGLRALGADVDADIPDRISDGYGLNERIVRKAAEDQTELLITCDNGISAVDPIRLAREEGMTVIITDHHEVPFREKDGERLYVLPPADAIVNPRQEDCPYPEKNICGAVVAWKLIKALYERAGRDDLDADRFLELAAFATVGDVMELKGENRILVRKGLQALKNSGNIGLRELIRAVDLRDREISTYHVGFVLGPCINAGGRLDSARRSLELLLEKDPAKAASMAGELKDLNESRKALTEKGVEEAVEQIQKTLMLKDRVLVVYLPDCHESLAGIIAGRIRERYNRPCFVLTKSQDGVKGSGRSIEEYSMYEELVKCEDLLLRFGGHPMAAGLSLEEDRIEEFRKRLNDNCQLTAEDLSQKVLIDAAMPIAYISKRLIGQISLLEPFGKGNTKPLFAQKDLQVTDSRLLGRSGSVIRLHVSDANGVTMQAVCFKDAEKLYEELRLKRRIAITYYPEINSYQGRESVQLVIQNYKVY